MAVREEGLMEVQLVEGGFLEELPDHEPLRLNQTPQLLQLRCLASSAAGKTLVQVRLGTERPVLSPERLKACRLVRDHLRPEHLSGSNRTKLTAAVLCLRRCCIQQCDAARRECPPQHSGTVHGAGCRQADLSRGAWRHAPFGGGCLPLDAWAGGGRCDFRLQLDVKASSLWFSGHCGHVGLFAQARDLGHPLAQCCLQLVLPQAQAVLFLDVLRGGRTDPLPK
mmetsp:Transcript_44953/g.140932  ORF Transcript_44953/g.140932 Transcript_44953/m.140932 type:complete len:224 (-) Transcript_44953:129-800(-)